MKRFALASIAALVCSTAVPSGALAQAPKNPSPAASTTTDKAKWIAPVKGTAAIEVIRSNPQKVGTDMVTTLKIRNASNGAIALLRVEEYWYDRSRKMVSGDTEFYRKQFYPGDVIEIKTKSPVKPDLYTNVFKFTHANGEIKATAVKKFQ